MTSIFLLILSVLWPAWHQLEPIRSQVSPNIHINDVASRMTPGYFGIYRDSDPVTTVHESTHGINAMLRNRHGGEVNAFYVFDGRYTVLPEPRFGKSAVARFVLPEFRESGLYRLYVVGQQSFEEDPLYIFDEWVAYTNGAEMGLRTDTLANALIFNFYAAALLQAVDALDPGYAAREELHAFFRWNLGRTFYLAERYGGPEHRRLVDRYRAAYP